MEPWQGLGIKYSSRIARGIQYKGAIPCSRLKMLHERDHQAMHAQQQSL